MRRLSTYESTQLGETFVTRNLLAVVPQVEGVWAWVQQCQSSLAARSYCDFPPGSREPFLRPCYHATVFNFGKPKTVGDWIVHVAGAVVALFLVWWMLRSYVL